MRLHLDNHLGLSGAGQAGAASGTQGTAPGGSRAGGELRAGLGDSVGLSGPSAALSRFAADRAARIQQLSAAVQGGTYNISSAAIGGALVRQSIS